MLKPMKSGSVPRPSEWRSSPHATPRATWRSAGGRLRAAMRRAKHAFAMLLGICAAPAFAQTTQDPFPTLPAPPSIEELAGLRTSFPNGRKAYLDQIRRIAEEFGLPPALADAVAFVESGYAADAVGADGEVGLMQVLPSTAVMLGHSGDLSKLADPETNIRYGVLYLAQAWQLAAGDVCRALMKYRAGHNEERMSALSARYCARARSYLASIGSELGAGAAPLDFGIGGAFARSRRTASLVGAPLPRWRLPGRPGRPRTLDDSRRFWAEHEARIRAINARLKPGRTTGTT